MNRIFLTFAVVDTAETEFNSVWEIASPARNKGQPIGSVRRPVTIPVAVSAGPFWMP